MKRFCKIRFTILLILALLLNGCAKPTATETIIDNHIQHYNEVLDYANNNLEDSPDTRYLKSELKSCVLSLSDVKETHRANMDTCEAEKKYWRLSTLFLGLVVLGAILAKLKRFIK